jgi:hypothetical protein
MNMDVAQLTAFLAPFLAPLLAKTQAAAAEAVATFGEQAWRQAREIWRRLAGRVEERPATQEAAEDVANSPDNEGARGALAWQLEKLLAADPALRDAVAGLWQEAVAAGMTVTVTASGERSVAVGRDVRDSRIATGDTTEDTQRSRPGGPPEIEAD